MTERENTKITNIRNEIGDITIDPAGGYYKENHIHKQILKPRKYRLITQKLQITKVNQDK